MPSLAQVLARARKASRQSRPRSLRVPPETLRLVTWQRMSFSEPLVCSGISGRSSTLSNSALLACSRASRRSRGDEASFAGEDAIELCHKDGLALRGGRATIGLEIAVELPDRRAHGGLGGAVLVREGVELVNQALGMNPAQAVLANIELPGIVADDYTVAQKAVGLDAAPQRAFGGDQHGVRIDLQGRDAELFQVRRPGLLIGEVTVGMFGEPGDHMASQRAFAHIGERGVIDDVIAMAGAQQAEKIEAALRGGGDEGGEMGVADLGAEAVSCLVACAGVIHRDRQPGAQYIARFVAKAILAGGQQADHLALGNVD